MANINAGEAIQYTESTGYSKLSTEQYTKYLANIRLKAIGLEPLYREEKYNKSPYNHLERLHSNNLKINLDKCFFGNKEVSYLGFTLTPAGIKPGKNKLKAIKNAKPPTDVKTIRSFVGLCNFFRTHIKNFAIIAAPLFLNLH